MDEAGKGKKPFLFGVDFEMREGFFLPDPLKQQDILFNVSGITNSPGRPGHIPTFHFKIMPIPIHAYKKRFQKVTDRLKRGDSYLTNLTIKTGIESSLSLHDIFLYSTAMYKLYIPGRLVCFSPERFVRMEQGRIQTHPMKGTIDARIPDAREMILNDTKETSEHNTIVDLLRNDMSRIATGVRVNRFRYIDELQTNNGAILQVSSEIEGTLPEDYLENLGLLFFELLPAGSVSGAPKRVTLDIIREAEQEPRGFYTGVAGYFDGETLDTFVLIRFIEQKGSDLYFRSGGGITANSICRSEYQEAIQKVYLPFQSASFQP
jgi:Anthranilate/para-aminobenzoate synthases component I